MESKRNRLEILRQNLQLERQSFIPLWQDCNDFILSSAGRFFIDDVNRGDRRNLKIINSTGTMAANTLHAGMMSGITSPARPWFRLASPDPDMNEYGAVKEWTHLVAQRMNAVFTKSNLYKVLPYRLLGTFGTAPFSLESHFDNLIHFQNYAPGSYCIAVDEYGKVNVFFRWWKMKVRNLVSRFGKKDQHGNIDWSNFSVQVKNQYDRGNYDAWIEVAHVICPNEDHVYGSKFGKQKKFLSCYYETGTSQVSGARDYMSNNADNDKYLEESGYDQFPVLCPRWQVTGEDSYATDWPGLTAIGDIKQLQHSEKKYGKALDKLVDPPMIYPSNMANSKVSLLPGDSIFGDVRDGLQGARSLHDVNLRIDHLDMKISKIEQRIQRAYYEDLFLMIARDDRNDRATAKEISVKEEERLLAVGPVLEQINQDVLDPMIDMTFAHMLKAGLIPPPPELEGMQLKIEYISIMAQAQKMIGVGTSERFMNSILTIAPAYPQVWDKVDVDQYVDNYSDNLSIAPGIVRTDEAVENLRAAQKEVHEKQSMAENIPAIAGAAKTLSETDVSGDNALTELMNQAQAGQQGEAI